MSNLASIINDEISENLSYNFILPEIKSKLEVLIINAVLEVHLKQEYRLEVTVLICVCRCNFS